MNRLFLFFTAMIFIACNDMKENDPENDFDLASVKRQIHEANTVYGERFKTNDTAYYAAKYCRDAVIMPEQIPMIAGLDSIRHFNYNNGKNRDFIISVTATNIYGSADAVVEEGFYTFPGTGGVIYGRGKFIAIWKQEDGKWKLYREIWNTDAKPK